MDASHDAVAFLLGTFRANGARHKSYAIRALSLTAAKGGSSGRPHSGASLACFEIGGPMPRIMCAGRAADWV